MLSAVPPFAMGLVLLAEGASMDGVKPADYSRTDEPSNTMELLAVRGPCMLRHRCDPLAETVF